jgi:hypothetical protein
MRTIQNTPGTAEDAKEIVNASIAETDLGELEIPVSLYGFSIPIGVLAFLDGTLVTIFYHSYHSRKYWVVQSSRDLPFEPARFLNVHHGSTIRAYGYPKGTRIRRTGCGFWHVDTLDKLEILVQTLKKHFGEFRRDLPTPDEIISSGALSDGLARGFVSQTRS